MSEPFVYYVGPRDQVAHHAAPLQSHLPIGLTSFEQAEDSLRPGDVAVFVSEHFEEARETIQRLRQRKVATLYAIDGILEWRNAWDNTPSEKSCPWTMRPCLSDKVAVIGPSQARVLASWGNSGKLELTGVPRFDRLWSSRPSAEQVEKRLSEKRPLRVLIATAKCPGFTPEQVAVTTQSLRDLRDYFESLQAKGASLSVDQQIEPIWRLTAGLDRELGVKTQIADLTGADFATQLASADVVICSASTAMLEAMILGKPVALLDYHRVPQLVPTAWQINAPEQIPSVLQSLRLSTELDRRRYAWQEHCLSDSLWSRSEATTRMVSLVTRMHEVANDCVHRDQPLAFPDQLLPTSGQETGIPAVASVPMEWLFPAYPEMAADDVWLLRSELAQARRELRYVRADLAQAHQVLDRWQRLPIVSQLLKLGAWWRKRSEEKQAARNVAQRQAAIASQAREAAP